MYERKYDQSKVSLLLLKWNKRCLVVVVLLRPGGVLHTQEVSVATLLIPLLHLEIRADGKRQLPGSLATILITRALLQAHHVLVVFVPIRKGEREKNHTVESRHK
jgi:hypothetical protein